MDDEYLVNRRTSNVRRNAPASYNKTDAADNQAQKASAANKSESKANGSGKEKKSEKKRGIFSKKLRGTVRKKTSFPAFKKIRISENTKKILRYYVANAAVVLLIALIIGGAVIAVFSANLKATKAQKFSDYTMVIGHKGGEVYHTHKLSGKYYRDGCVYVPINEIAELGGLIITGDISELKYIAQNGSASFTLGTRYVNINGNSICLSEVLCGDYTDLLVPIDFIDCYVSGVKTVTDTEKRIISIDFPQTDDTIPGQETADNVLLYKLYSVEDSGSIDFNWLPESVRAQLREVVTEPEEPPDGTDTFAGE